jgi:hypothetical protein
MRRYHIRTRPFSGRRQVSVTQKARALTILNLILLISIGLLFAPELARGQNNDQPGDTRRDKTLGGGGLVVDDDGVECPGAPFTTIQAAVTSATAGDTIQVCAGTYKENVTINKSLTLNGANAGIAGNAVRGAESIILTNGNQLNVVTVTAANVIIDGFTVDGDDPLVTGVTLFSGDDTNVQHGIRVSAAFGGQTVRNNIIRRVSIGWRGDSGLAGGSLITANWFDSIGNFDFGYAVNFRNDVYGDVTNNLMTRVWTGIHTSQHNAAGGPASWTVSGNEIHSYASGLDYWNHFGSATPLTFTNNQITAEPAAVANNFGILIVTINDSINPVFTGNTITGTDYGVGITNSSTANTVTFDGTNTVSDAGVAGVLLTNNLNFNPVGTTSLLFPGVATAVNISGMPVTAAAGATGVSVVATNATPAAVTIGISVATTIEGGAAGIAVEGDDASIVGNTFNDTALNGQTNNYIFLSNGALEGLEIDADAVTFDGTTGAVKTLSQNLAAEDKIVHELDAAALGFIRVKTGNIFVTPDSGSIQRGIDAAAPGEILNVASGTYAESVDVNKAVTLFGEPTITGTLTASASGAAIGPGFSPGIIASGDLTLVGGTTLGIELNGPAPGTGYDQLNVTGGVSLGNATLSVTAGFTPGFGNRLTIIDNDGGDPVTGTFNGLAEGSMFILGPATYQVTYTGGTGNDVQLIVTVSPTSSSVPVGGTIRSANGVPVPKARVVLTNAAGVTRSALSNAFGNYRFENVRAGEAYFIGAVCKGFTFSPRFVVVGDELTDLDFTAEP